MKPYALVTFLDGVRAFCIVVLALGPQVAYAQPAPPSPAPQVTPENTPEACTDRLDNDGDGWVDCGDQDCMRLPQCAQPQTAPPPPPVYQQPYPQPYPQPYQQPYAQPAPVYQPSPAYPPPSLSPVQTEQPPFGLVTGIIGSALLVIGFGMLMGSIDPWLAAGCTAGTPLDPTGNCRHDSLRDTGIVLDVFGGVFFVVGVIMTPIGWMQYGRYRRWKAQQPRAFMPTLRASGDGAVGGLKFSF